MIKLEKYIAKYVCLVHYYRVKDTCPVDLLNLYIAVFSKSNSSLINFLAIFFSVQFLKFYIMSIPDTSRAINSLTFWISK